MSNKDWTDKLPALLEGLEEAAPEGLWDAVQAGVTPTRRRVAAVWWYAAAALAVAAAVVLAVLLWKPADSSAPGAPVAPVLVSPVPEDRLVEDFAVPETLPSALERPSPAPKSGVLCSSAPISAVEAPQTPDSCLSAENEAEREQNEPQTHPERPSERPAPQTKPKPAPQVEPIRWPTEAPVKKRKGSWQVGVSGGGLLAQANSTSAGIGLPFSPLETKASTIPIDALTRNKASTTESKYRQGLRGSVLVNYRFAKRWSVGTGVSISSLISEFTTTAENSTQATIQNTLYLGIPINAQFNILDIKRFQLYVTGGPMVELPLYKHTSTGQWVGGQSVESSTTQPEVRPFDTRSWRWSANLAAGVQYQLFSHGALFVQPGLCWHIPGKANEDDIYSSRPVAFDLNLGFRFLLF